MGTWAEPECATMADTASAEVHEGLRTMTARRFNSGDVAARRRAPASLGLVNGCPQN
jgi:hypothetical protein